MEDFRKITDPNRMSIVFCGNGTCSFWGIYYDNNELLAEGKTFEEAVQKLLARSDLFAAVELQKVEYEDNDYFIYEVDDTVNYPDNEPPRNLIAIDGKTLGHKRCEHYDEPEVGYVVEAVRIDNNTFRSDTIWLRIAENGWAEAETIVDKEGISFIKSILKAGGLNLVIE